VVLAVLSADLLQQRLDARGLLARVDVVRVEYVADQVGERPRGEVRRDVAGGGSLFEQARELLRPPPQQ
jgi:hypothetical protein